MTDFKSLSEMEKFYSGWTKTATGNGVRYLCPEEIGTGYVEVIGNVNRVFLFNSNYTKRKGELIRSYQKERAIAISDTRYAGGTYYRDKSNTLAVAAGINCRINAVPTLLYARIEDNTPVNATGFIIRERFLEASNISFEQCSLEQMAHCLNDRPVYSNALLMVCKQLRHIPVDIGFVSLYLEAKAMEVISLLMQLTVDTKDKPVLSKEYFESIKMAKCYLDDNYSNPPGIDDLCKQFYLNKNLLQSGFKSLTGHTVYDYILYQRINHSIQMLIASDAPIADIAKKVGFGSKMNYYSAFKRVFLMTPHAMREAFRHHQDAINAASD